MTGYLQRLITTAVQGQAGVRPIVRPPWTGRAFEPAVAWPEFGDDAGTRVGAPATSLAAPDVPDLRAPADGTAAPLANLSRGLPRTASAPPPTSSHTSGPEPLTLLFGTVPTPGPATPVPPAGASDIARAPAGYRPLPSAPPNRGLAARMTAAGPDSPGPRPARTRPGPAVTQPIRQQPPHLAGRAAPEPHGGSSSGDIEIHIGRIEVTAMTLPPPAPPGKAARKSINLGDYLRNGR